MTDDDRLTMLEQRVSDLEARLRPASSDPSAPSGAGQPDFWALEGLSQRVEEPGAVLMVGHVQLPDGRTAQWQEAAATQDLLDGDWDASSETLAALGHPVRLRLLQQVLRGVDTVPRLTETDGVGTSGQVYHHVRQLASSGWLRAMGGGRYEVPVGRVVPVLVVIMGARR